MYDVNKMRHAINRLGIQELLLSYFRSGEAITSMRSTLTIYYRVKKFMRDWKLMRVVNYYTAPSKLLIEDLGASGMVSPSHLLAGRDRRESNHKV